MSEPTTIVEPTTVAETAQPEIVQKDGAVPTTEVKAAEEPTVVIEPQNNLTKKFTDAEWTGIKELRVRSV